MLFRSVERSIDGANFSRLGQLRAAGNSNINVSYNFTDGKVQKGSNFYRLKMINTDGTFRYSKVVNINSDLKDVDFYLVYPNPFSTNVQVRVESDRSEQIMMRIVNMEGKTIKVQTATVQSGINNIIINDVAGLQRGIYYFEITTSVKTSRTKIIRQ